MKTKVFCLVLANLFTAFSFIVVGASIQAIETLPVLGKVILIAGYTIIGVFCMSAAHQISMDIKELKEDK